MKHLLALLFYTILLNISREIEYMWLKSFSFPTFFYILTRYTYLFEQVFLLTVDTIPMSVVSCAFLRTLVEPLTSSSQSRKTLCFQLFERSKNRRSCNILSHITGCLQCLGDIGVQGQWSQICFGRDFNDCLGLLVIRAYSICYGNKIIVAALASGILVGIVFNLLGESLNSNRLCRVSSRGNLTLFRNGDIW